MQITLKPLTGQPISLEVEPSTTVACVKIKLYDAYGIDPGACVIRKGPIVMEDHETFARYQINDGDIPGLMTLFGTYKYKLPARGISEQPLTERQLIECYEKCFPTGCELI